MPGTYCYRCHKCGNTMERLRVTDDRNKPVRCVCGNDMPRDIAGEHRPRSRHDQTAGNWRDFHSDAASIDPRDANKFRAFDQKMGVPTEYDKMGRPKFTSQRHRAGYLKAHGMFDKDGGY